MMPIGVHREPPRRVWRGSSVARRAARSARDVDAERAARLLEHARDARGKRRGDRAEALGVAAVDDLERCTISICCDARRPRPRRSCRAAGARRPRAPCGPAAAHSSATHAERLGGRLAVLDDRRRVAARARALRRALRLGGEDRLDLERSFASSARRRWSSCSAVARAVSAATVRLVLDRLGLGLELGDLGAEAVLLLEHHRLGLLLRASRRAAAPSPAPRATRCLASFSAFCASRSIVAICARPRFARYFCSSETCCTLSTSSSSPSLSKSSFAFSHERLGELEAILVHLLGRELARAPRGARPRASAARPADLRRRRMPRKRSTAWRTCFGSVEIFTLAIACTVSGMPPLRERVRARRPRRRRGARPCATPSRGTACGSARPPWSTLKPTVDAVRQRCLRPEKTRISFGGQM